MDRRSFVGPTGCIAAAAGCCWLPFASVSPFCQPARQLALPHPASPVCCPPHRTTIWHGTADTAVPPVHGRWYHETISGSTLNLLEGEGHVTPLVKFSTAILEEALGLALA